MHTSLDGRFDRANAVTLNSDGAHMQFEWASRLGGAGQSRRAWTGEGVFRGMSRHGVDAVEFV